MLSGASRDSHACPCHDNTSTMLYRWGCMLGIFCCSLFSPYFCFPITSSLFHRSINTVPKLFWLTFVLFTNSNLVFLCLVLVRGCILLCSICNSVSKSPEDSRLSENHPSFLEVVGDFTDTSFRVHFLGSLLFRVQSFYDLSVINYCWFSQPIW